MARRSTKRAFIVNDSKRRTAYKKRKNGLMKKTMELSTLCGVEACAIIYNRNEAEPEVWPSHFGVQSVLHKFLPMPPMEQRKKMYDQQSFLRERVDKAEEQLKKMKIQNRKKMISLLMIKCLGTGMVEGNIDSETSSDLIWMIEKKLHEVDQKLTRGQLQEGTLMATNRF